MLRRHFVICFLLFFTLSAGADGSAFPALTAAGESLQQDLLSGIKSLDRETRFYHYFRAPSDPSNPLLINPFLTNKPNRDGWLEYFFGFRMGAFWDPNNHVTEMTAAGPGMYFAIDPAVSREFGESAVVMKLPAGMKYLNLVKPISLRKETRDLLVQENIISKAQLNSGEKLLGLSRGFSADTLKNFVREENAEFRKLVSEIFHRSNIVFIEYSWKSALAGFCKKDSQSAFVLIGLKPQNIQNETEDSVTESSEVLGGLPEEVRGNFLFFSDFEVPDLSESELLEKDLLGRFRHTLARIKEKGTSKAQKYIQQNLNDEEVTELADKTYRCERRY